MRSIRTRLLRIAQALAFGALGAASGCRNLATAPEYRDVAGDYVLTSVDGALLPVTLSAGDGCPMRITDGQLGLGLWRESAFYSVLVAGNASCGSTGSEPVRTAFVQDRGDWSRPGASVQFESKSGLGRYSGAVSAHASDEDITMTVVIAGHQYRWRRVLVTS